MKPSSNLLRVTALALCLVGLGVAGAMAANSEKLQTEQGMIKSVDQAHRSLVLTNQKEKAGHSFQWNEQTKFTEGGKAVSATDLKAGEHALISYESAKGVAMAKSISLTPAKAEKQPQSHSSHTGKSK